MPENEPKRIDPRDLRPTPTQKVSEYASFVAETYGLDTLTCEALSKYANAYLRIKEISKDFKGTKLRANIYASYPEENGDEGLMVIDRENYPYIINTLCKIAFSIHDLYLSESQSSRTAAREVKDLVNGIYPKRP